MAAWTISRLIVDSFSFEEVHSILALNNGQVIGCFDEMSSFYGQLDFFELWPPLLIEKHSSLSMGVAHGHAISKTTWKKLHSTSHVSFSMHLFTKCVLPATTTMTGNCLIFLQNTKFSWTNLNSQCRNTFPVISITIQGIKLH